jgi:hypothetical protein
MAATQHGSSTTFLQTLLGTDNSTKGKKVETAIQWQEPFGVQFDLIFI